MRMSRLTCNGWNYYRKIWLWYTTPCWNCHSWGLAEIEVAGGLIDLVRRFASPSEYVDSVRGRQLGKVRSSTRILRRKPSSPGRGGEGIVLVPIALVAKDHCTDGIGPLGVLRPPSKWRRVLRGYKSPLRGWCQKKTSFTGLTLAAIIGDRGTLRAILREGAPRMRLTVGPSPSPLRSVGSDVNVVRALLEYEANPWVKIEVGEARLLL